MQNFGKTTSRFLILLSFLIGQSFILHAASEFPKRTTISLVDTEWQTASESLTEPVAESWSAGLPGEAAVMLPQAVSSVDHAQWFARKITFPKSGSDNSLLIIENLVGQADIFLDGKLLSSETGNGITCRVIVPGIAGSTTYLALRYQRSALVGRPAQLRGGLGPILLQTLPKTRIERLSCSVTPSRDALLVNYQLAAEQAETVRLNFRVTRYGSEKRITPIKTINIELAANMVHTGEPLIIPCPALTGWMPNDKEPQRYQLHAELSHNKSVTDIATLSCGVSALAINSDLRLTLNDQPIILRGMRLAGGLPPPIPDHSFTKCCTRESSLLKAANFNAIMNEDAAPVTEMLKTAERSGMMIIVDIPPAKMANFGGPVLAADIRRAAEEFAHHPCVIAWYWRSSGDIGAELRALRYFDRLRPAIIETKQGTLFYPADINKPIDIAALDYPQDSIVDEIVSLQQAFRSKLPLLLLGTPAFSSASFSFQEEELRINAARMVIETLLNSAHPLGYFMRPLSRDTLSGLSAINGRYTRAYYNALAVNNPQLLLPQVTYQNGILTVNIKLINDALLTGIYRFSMLLTFPDGVTRFYRQSSDAAPVSEHERNIIVERLPRVNTTISGDYRLQLVMAEGTKVTALSRILSITITPAGELKVNNELLR